MWQDLRYACRRIRQSPAVSVVATITLALGIGANAAIYSAVDALLFHPLPYHDPESLRQLWSLMGSSRSVLVPFETLRMSSSERTVFSDLQPYRQSAVTLTGAGDPATLGAADVGGGLMQMLRVAPALGRAIGPDDARPGAEPVVVLSDTVWRQRFAGDPGTIGRRIRIDGTPRTVIGVMPPSFHFPFSTQQLWMPLAFVPTTTTGRPAAYSAIARLAPGVTEAQAQARVDALAAAFRGPAGTDRGVRVLIGPPLAGRVSPDMRRVLLVLAGAVGGVLLIACANVANLLLVAAVGRARETAVRAALGASASRLLRSALAEAVVLGAAGTAAGLLLAALLVTTLRTALPSDLTFLSVTRIAVNWRVVAFAAGLLVATVTLFGIAPAVAISRAAPQDALRAGGRGATGSRHQGTLRGALVVVQLALSIALLVGAGLLVRSFLHVTRVDPGFDPRNLVAADLALPRTKYPTHEAQAELLSRMKDAIGRVPGVSGLVLTGGIPPHGGGISFDLAVEVEGHGVVLRDPALVLPFSEVQSGFFSLMRIPLVAGRDFDATDRPGSTPAVIVSESFARRLWNSGNPIGQRMRLSADSPWNTVVGVVGDVYQDDVGQTHGAPSMYYPLSQETGIPFQQTIVVRTSTDASRALGAIRQAIGSVDPEQPIESLATVDDLYGQFFAAPRFYAMLMTALAVLGIVVAAVGLYGVLAAAVAARTREFCIRLALGAPSANVVGLALLQAAVLCAVGLAVGFGAAAWVGDLLRTILVDVSPFDPAAYIGVGCVFLAVASIAAWIPATRTRRIDVTSALRAE